jgi:mycothiol synthase
MDARYAIRPFRDDDFERQAEIANRLFPDQPTTAEEGRRWDRAIRGPGLFNEALAAAVRSSGEVVAAGQVNHFPFAYDPDWYGIGVLVDPDHQGRGIGSEIYGKLEATAHSRHAKGLWAAAREDNSRGLRFFSSAGFSEHRRAWMSVLDLAQPPSEFEVRGAAQSPGPDVQFTTLAELGSDRGETLERFHRLHQATAPDAPSMGRSSPLNFDQFRELLLDPAELLPEGVFIARAGEKLVAFTMLGRDPTDPAVLHTPFTGTMRDYRRRGLATALKCRAVQFARSRGYRSIRTGNDSTNLPMWSINERLGFRRQRTWIFGEKRLD